MARKEAKIRIEADGRDKGKVFLLREMPAAQGERWALRAFLALARGGAEVPDDVMHSGFAGLSTYGLKLISHMSFDDAESLMAEMFECISIIPDPSRNDFSRGLVEDDIEEIATRVKLRIDVFKLHVDFSKAVAPSTSAQASAASNPTASSTT
jgi:thiamine monophosphate kinase